jgi:hypothetical protein
LKTKEAAHWIKQFYDSSKQVRLFSEGTFVDTTVGDMAREAVARIEGV